MGLEPDGGVGETQHRLLMVEEGMTLSYTASHHISVPSFIEPVSRQLITGPAFWNFVGPNVTVMVCVCVSVCVCVCVCVYTHTYILHAYIHTYIYYMHICVYIHVLFVTPWGVAHLDPLSMGFPRQEYCTGGCCDFRGIFLTQGQNLSLLQWQEDSLPLSHLGGPQTSSLLL